MINRIEISLPDRFKNQQSLKENRPGSNKENRGMGSNSGNKGTPRLEQSNSVDKDTISDSGSMYEYNPLIRARRLKK